MLDRDPNFEANIWLINDLPIIKVNLSQRVPLRLTGN